MRGDDDRVNRRLKLCKRVAHGADGVGLDDEAVRRDTGGTELIERLVEPPAGRGAARVILYDISLSVL